ncbi:MAG: M28 family peptidase, partial [Nakamurella sp.]
MKHRTAGRSIGVIAMAGLLLLGGIAAPASAAPKANPTKLAEKLVKQVTANGANRHLIAFQRIADRNGGNRAVETAQAGTSSAGYNASVDYVVGRLTAWGFDVQTPTFDYDVDKVDASSLTVGDDTYNIDKMNESIDTPAAGTTGPLAVVPEDATTGCETADFASGDYTGTVTLIRRGGCTFEIKSNNAAAAGAVAVVISNNVPGPLVNVTITNEGPVPVGGISQQDGTTLATSSGEPTTVDMRSHVETITLRNVIAQTRTGRPDNVVMLGAHLDSVQAGPGINDNGSGSAALLEIANKLGPNPKVNNAVRFGWWGAEELGLIGSTEYVRSLTFEQQLNIALYMNFDMIASPNVGYFVYDGDDSDGTGAGPGPYGSAQIEQTFTDFFTDELGIPTQGTDFSGRSDYGEFIANGIPAGGLFTGAEGLKTAEQVELWGGTAGVAYDPCYHAACDNLGNVDRDALDANLDAAAWATGFYGYSTEDVNGV